MSMAGWLRDGPPVALLTEIHFVPIILDIVSIMYYPVFYNCIFHSEINVVI